MFPLWLAVMVQLPAATIDTVAVVTPLNNEEAPTEQTPDVAAKLTMSPELVEVEILNDASP